MSIHRPSAAGLHVENLKLIVEYLKLQPDGDRERGGASCGSHKESRHPRHLALQYRNRHGWPSLFFEAFMLKSPHDANNFELPRSGHDR